jgi:hypothetical protein
MVHGMDLVAGFQILFVGEGCRVEGYTCPSLMSSSSGMREDD